MKVRATSGYMSVKKRLLRMGSKIMTILLWSVPILLLFSFVGIQIYCWIKYGNVPIGETPNWVQWIMFGRR